MAMRDIGLIEPDFCALKLKPLADATRLTILELLLSGPKHVSQMNVVLGLEQSLLSHHLKVLREADLVRSQRDGKAVLYTVAPGVRQTETGTAIDLGCCQLCFDRPHDRS